MYVGYWLRSASNEYAKALSRKVEDKGVTVAEWAVLRELYDAEMRPTTLAEKLGVTRGAISKLADRLEAKLMLTQQASPLPGDARAQMLSITDFGRAVVPVLGMHADETDEEFFGHLDRRTRALIVSTLREIVRRPRPSWPPPADY